MAQVWAIAMALVVDASGAHAKVDSMDLAVDAPLDDSFGGCLDGFGPGNGCSDYFGRG